MDEQKKILLAWIEEDRERLIEFLSRFVQAKSPNPPGDTREVTAFICNLLDQKKLPYRIISPHPEMPNIVASFECGKAGRHLVLNGHTDVFPVGDEKWSYDPWSGTVANGRIYGRGVCDMKCGTAASIFTFAYLHRIRDRLKGKLTLTAVSDEETFGPWGARYLMEHHPEVHGDCCLNGEPSSIYGVRFGERGLLWLALKIVTPGAHGAYTHLSPSATKLAARLIIDLEAVTEIEVPVVKAVAEVLKRAASLTDQGHGKGASEIVPRITLNIGTIHGGLKVNMIPGECIIETDIRLPIGAEKDIVMREIRKILERYPQVSLEEIGHAAPSWCDPHGEMMEYIRGNVRELKGFEPLPIVSLGGTDARLWRYRNVPAYIYGPTPHGVGRNDEYVEIDDFLHVVRTHVLSAYDYLKQN
jgi:succinyl-diaminopimelate desuccinylase